MTMWGRSASMKATPGGYKGRLYVRHVSLVPDRFLLRNLAFKRGIDNAVGYTSSNWGGRGNVTDDAAPQFIREGQ